MPCIFVKFRMLAFTKQKLNNFTAEKIKEGKMFFAWKEIKPSSPLFCYLCK